MQMILNYLNNNLNDLRVLIGYRAFVIGERSLTSELLFEFPNGVSKYSGISIAEIFVICE